MKNTLNETRLDRIERNLESFFIGMQELKESQKRTSKQIMELKESQKRTDEQLNRTDAQLSRTDAQLQKTIKKLDDIGDRLRDMGFAQDEVDE
jgi:septation ring formation regulator EzrA